VEKPSYLTFEDMQIGLEGPALTYTVTAEAVEKYALAVEHLDPLFLDDKVAAESEWGGRIAPPTGAAMFLLSPREIGGKLNPPGRVHAKQQYEFHRPTRVGDVLTARTVVVDRYIKRERKYVAMETVVVDQFGEKVVTSRGTSIWPF